MVADSNSYIVIDWKRQSVCPRTKKKPRKLITKDMEDVNLKIVHEIHFQFHDLSTFTQ